MNRRLYHFEGSKLSALRIAAACTVCLIQSTIATSDDQTFRTLVAPLFEEKCLSCHNDGDRKGQLSLVDRDSAMNGGESGAAIVPSDKRASRLLDMIRVKAGKARMPKGGQPLRSDEIAAVENWIADGARWPDSLRLSRPEWWSRRPLTRPGVPRVNDPEFEIRTPIDAFILRTLRQHGLQPSVEADRTTLVRRLYFDLLGLPPTPREVSRFVNDSSADAYERLVDRLLASPHYGERWARHWLDVVKYADTCGYDKDKLRPNAWPYRDYVVRSLNSDKPYWQFVHEQIAGDALFPGEPDGILGLGFVAAGPWDFIGHVEVPESKIDGKVARNLDRDDMVSNVLNTFCSVTIQCARCHDHKFDPITQEHYYGLQAVFAAVDRADRPYDEDPDVRARRGDLTAQLDTSQEALARLEEQVKEEGGAQLVALDARIAELQKETRASEVNPAFGYHSSIASSADDRKWVQVELEEPTEFTQIVLRPCQDDFAGIGAGFGFPVRFRVEAANDRQFKQAVVPVADYTTKDFVNPALDPLVIEFETTEARYVRVTATRLAERQNDYIFALAELQVLDGAGTNVAKGGGVESLDSIESMPRWGRANLTDGIWPEAAAPASARQLAASESARRTLLARIEPSDDRLERERLAAMVQELSDELTELPAPRMVYAAATDFKSQGNFKPTEGEPRLIRLLHRGNILDPGDEVRPGTLPIVPGVLESLELAEDHAEADRRAALARWLTRTDHPLTWRSIVNRVWLYHFGRGIADSPNDFGSMGQQPSHPQLLDWLACEFRDGGQSFKKLHRLIVTSSVYRQMADHEPRQASIDSDNQYLWRMNRRRLTAEEIRDAVLAVSGKLDKEMYGPGFYLFELEKTEHSPHYEYHKHDPEDPASHRRSIYRFIVRSQPDPFMTTLDCADSSQSTPRRNETLTSLQALSLLNNKFTLAMAVHFASRLEKEAESLPTQLARGVWLTTSRAPDPSQQSALVDYADRHGLPNACRVLFNLSEFVFVD